MSSNPAFTFVDLFAGVGGFHAALSALGGECVYAVENDPAAAAVYERNWRMPALGDIVADTTGVMKVPAHDVLAAGFPCQPFSKSGNQRGMDETRGTLFWHILEVLRVHRPTVILLENVRNIAGPRHAHEWDIIIRSLRQLGYRVSATPFVFSPHLLPPERGGRPQVRERVFILGTHVGERAATEDVEPTVVAGPVDGWHPQNWELSQHLPLETELDRESELKLRLSPAESEWIAAWDDFILTLRKAGATKLPGFPVWQEAFVHEDDLVIAPATPAWKANFLRKNSALYTQYQDELEAWMARWNYLDHFPPSRRKLEWQAQDAASLRETVMHLRPSGLRAKRPTYLPALVAITQTSILGDRRRRLSPREAARLQGLPEWFDFGDQPDAATYKQMGNGVNVGAAYHVVRQHILATINVVKKRQPGLGAAVQASPESPDATLERYWDSSRQVVTRESGASSTAKDEAPIAV